MKRVYLLIILVPLISLIFCCTSNDKIEQLERKLAITTLKLDSLITEFNKPYTPDPYWKYTWFDLGKDYHQIVNRCFYVSSIKTTYKENGFDVTGIIANLDAVSMSNVKIQCAIRDSSIAERLTFGFSEIPYLLSGRKFPFSVFVPTQQTKVSQIGVSIQDFRM